MAWTDACKVEAVAQINKRIEKLGKVVWAIREFAEESGIPKNTLKRWYYPETDYKCTRTGTPIISPEKETCATSDLHTLMHDSGKKKIIFQLRETDDDRVLVMQEYRVGQEGKETTTNNRLTMPVTLIPQLREALEQAEAIIEEGRSGGSGAGDSGRNINDDGRDPLSSDEIGDSELGDQAVDPEESRGVGEKFSDCRNCRKVKHIPDALGQYACEKYPKLPSFGKPVVCGDFEPKDSADPNDPQSGVPTKMAESQLVDAVG